MFQDGVAPEDVKLGITGDIYFLTALSVLAEYPDRIRHLFVTDSINNERVFGCYFYINGQKILVMVDDFLPVQPNGKLVFSQAAKLWVPLLQKCWAKLHGSYEQVYHKSKDLAFRDLTGAPSFRYHTSEPGIWEMLLEGDTQ